VSAPSVTIVVPTIGRPTLYVLLQAITGTAGRTGPRPARIVVVDDRRSGEPLSLGDARGQPDVIVAKSGGRGPAVARNIGWRHARTEWVAFLDDDVVPDPDWLAVLHRDLSGLPEDVVGSQGQLTVPLPANRRPTDWERSTAGLETARWITADMAYRRATLSALGGFDERFPRAFREDADLALRALAAGGRLVIGQRHVQHPVRPASWWASVRAQRGNADDVLMARLHGRDWRARAQAPPGRRRRHLAVTGAAVGALFLTGVGQRRAAAVLTAAWIAGFTEFFLARWRPGPRTPDETVRMALTSAVIPPVATWHWARGLIQHRDAGPWVGLPEAVLLDRDGTLVVDVPYNGEPANVTPVPDAFQAVQRLRAGGLRVGVVTNQSGVGRGMLTPEQVKAVNDRIDQLLGPFDTWQVCMHAPDDRCPCRKPAPGLVQQGCAEVGVDPSRCVVIGDIAADINAAHRAGAMAVLVPTPKTRPDEVFAAPVRAPSLSAAVDLVLGGPW
jgi:histidinol-phosphate phosphatase family protein